MEILGIGPMELLLILIIALMVFGPDRLPEMGAKLGQSLRSVRRATHEFSREIEETRQAIEAPLNEIKQPLAEITQPINDLKQPFQDLKQPFEDLKNPLREMGHAAADLPVQAKEALTLAAGAVGTAVSPLPAGDNSQGATLTAAEEAGPAMAALQPDGPEGEAADLTLPAATDEAIAPTADQAGAGSEVAASVPEVPGAGTRLEGSSIDGDRPFESSGIAVAVINPHEALRQVIARQMRPGNEG